MTKKLQICGWPYSILHQTETTSFKVLNSTNLCARDCCFHCSMFEMWCEMTYSCCCSFHNQISLGVDSTHPVTSTSHLELLPSLVLYTFYCNTLSRTSCIASPGRHLAVWKYLIIAQIMWSAYISNTFNNWLRIYKDLLALILISCSCP